MFAGALVAGMLTAFFSAALNRWGRVPEDAAMGVVFSSLFAVGVVMITLVARDVDLDPGCVLYGLIEFAPYDTIFVWGQELPRAFVTLAAVLLANILFIIVLFKELRIVCFDPALATAMGINAAAVHYLLMFFVAGTAVASFESVGSILVVAMLVAPAAAAQLLTDRLSRMLLISAGIAAFSAVSGYLLALRWNTSVAGMLGVASGCCFFTAVFLAPRYGIVTKIVTRIRLAIRIAQEDVLGSLYRRTEAQSQVSPSFLSPSRSNFISHAAIAALNWKGLIRRAPRTAELLLTPAGKRAGEQVIRSHRLWEAYLFERLGLARDHLHEPSERMEHFISTAMADHLSQELQQKQDPHGRDIPPVGAGGGR
jgi:manganese/zinc/iron transport system permease protein